MKQLLRRITNIGARSNGALGTSSTVFNLSLDHMLGADQGKAASSLQLSDKHKGSSLSASSTKTNTLGSDSDKQVPVILQRFVEYLSSPEALETEGLFRIAAPVKQVKELRESIEKNGLAELSKLDPYDGINIVASLFKQWLRDIPEGVVPKSHFQKLVDCGASPSKLQAVLRTLPKPNLDFLEYLLKYLYKVVSHSSKNLMTVQNLVIVFAPNLFSCPSAPSVVSSGNPEKYLVESMQVTKIMANIMENYEEIFQVKGPKTKHSNRNSSSSRQSATLLNEEYEPIIPPFTRIKLNDELDESENDTSKIRPPPIPTAQQDQLIKQAVSDTVSSMLFPNTKRTTGPMSPSKSYNDLSKENSILLAELKKKLGHHSNQPQNIEDVVQNHSILSETDEIPAIQAESHVPQSENTPILTSVTKSRPKPPGRRPPAAPVDPSLRNALIFDKSAPVSPTARKAVLLEDTQPILPIEVLDEPILQIRESSTEALDSSKKKSVTFLDHDKNIERKKASSPIPPPPNKPAPPIPTSQSKKPQSKHAHNSTELLHKEIDRVSAQILDETVDIESGFNDGDDELSYARDFGIIDINTLSDDGLDKKQSHGLKGLNRKPIVSIPVVSPPSTTNLSERNSLNQVKLNPVGQNSNNIQIPDLTSSKAFNSSPNLGSPSSVTASSQRRASYRNRSTGSPRSQKGALMPLNPLQASGSGSTDGRGESSRTLGNSWKSETSILSQELPADVLNSPYLSHRKKRLASKEKPRQYEQSRGTASNSSLVERAVKNNESRKHENASAEMAKKSNSVESMRLVYILSDKDSKKLIEEEFRSLKSKIKLLRSTGAEIHKADRLRYKHLSGLIKELNQDGDISTTSLPPNQDTGSMSTLQISAKSSLERLARKRLRERRPKDIQDMSVEQLMEEKTAVKRELAHLKTQFKESSNLYTPEDKEIMRELYSRYCDIKSCIESRMDSSSSLRMSTDEIRVSNSELEQYALLRHEKKILQLQLHKFQDNFIKENGRRVKTADDRAPVQAEYKRYKELRSIIDEMENRLKLEVNDDEDS